MECVWPCAAVESQVLMRWVRFRSCLLGWMICGGAVVAPLSVFGHASEFLFARLELKPGGLIRLEVTADYGGNPLLPDEAAARAALEKTLLILGKEGARPLLEWAPMRIEKRTQWDPATPASFSPPADGTSHELLVGSWELRDQTEPVTFQVQKGSVHDVLLWSSDLKASDGGAKWMLLIEGESSPPIQPLPLAALSRTHQGWVLGIAGAVFLTIVLVLVRRTRLDYLSAT